MITHEALFVFVVSAFMTLALTTAGVYLHRAKRVGDTDEIATLLRRLVSVDRDKLAQVAADLSPSQRVLHADLEPWQVWELTGGLRGLQAVAANCEVLIDLACYVQRWYPEALPMAEQLRLNAREIQWHLERLQGAERRGNLEAAFPDYAQRAVAIYYGMTQHVLALFEVSQVPGLAQLQAAL